MARVHSLGALALLCAAILVGCGKKEDEGGGGGGGGSSDGQPVVMSRSADDKREAQHRLRQIGLGIHNHESVMGHLPVGFVAQKGQLGLSWRVAILPYVEQNDLYKQFKLDEPWDSPHNKPLVSQMPKVFESPGVVLSRGKTFLRTFSGPHAFLQVTTNTGAKGQPTFSAWMNQPPGSPARGRAIHSITDGTSNTLMVVEAAEAVEWTKPDEIAYLDQPFFGPGSAKLGPLPKLGLPSEGGFHGLFCDGSVRFIRDTTSEQTIRALITASGGEVVSLDSEGPRPWDAPSKPSATAVKEDWSGETKGKASVAPKAPK